jgi:hypothetical protein
MRDDVVNINDESCNECNVVRARSEDMWKRGLRGLSCRCLHFVKAECKKDTELPSPPIHLPRLHKNTLFDSRSREY